MAKGVTGLIIMDGFGYREEKNGNAILTQGTPYINHLINTYPNTLINASGRAVGLPEGLMGNSEVGHLNLGAGRVVYQDITMIDKSIEDGDFFTNEAFMGAVKNVRENGTALHLVGLTSDGGVHSSINHLFALIDLAKKENIEKLYVHAITDGRDVAPDSATKYIKMVQDKLASVGLGKVATVVGRYYYMDRDNRWERVEKGYDCVFNGMGVKYDNVIDGVKASYKNKVYDEFLEPIVESTYTGVNANDSIIFYNYRSDRAREISRCAIYPDFDKFERKGGYRPVFYVGMTEYDSTFTGIHTAYPPKDIKNTLGEYLANIGKTQVRIAETEKYAHVTFFFNGGVETPNKGEDRVLVASPKVATYDLQPEMSAYEVKDKALEALDKDYDVLIMNFANCDMVGHTGVFDAAVKAVETVDNCVKEVVEKILSLGGNVIVTADHGNAEVMFFENGELCTAHTTNPVPLIVAGEKYKDCTLKEGCALCDVAPTLLDIMGVEKPAEMTGQTIINK